LGEKRWRVFERGLSMVNKNAFVVSTEAMDEGGMDAMRETRRKKKKKKKCGESQLKTASCRQPRQQPPAAA